MLLEVACTWDRLVDLESQAPQARPSPVDKQGECLRPVARDASKPSLKSN